jgi:Secretion system C-terminal sorting domain/Beta-propeller repeat
MKRNLHLDSFRISSKPKPHSGLIHSIQSYKLPPLLFYLSIFFTFHISLLTFDLFSQQPTQEWVARYERPSGSSGIANFMALDKVGNCFVLGNLISNNTDVVLIKYNSAGDTSWTRKHQSVVNDIPYGVIADSIGNSFITFSRGSNFGPYDIVVVKYNPNGIQQWINTYDSGENDEPRDIAIDRNGNVYIAGFKGNESLILKYSSDGDTLWTRKYNEANYRFPVTDLILDNQNNIYVCGVRAHTTNNSSAQFTLKYDSNAVFKWINSPLVTQMAFPVKVNADNTGNVFVTGQSFIGKILTIKYNANGMQIWERIYDGPGSGSDRPHDMKIDNSGNVIITGACSGNGTGSRDYITIKYDTNGDSLWTRYYNGSANGNDEAYSLDLDDTSNIYVTGRSMNLNVSWDFSTIKYSSEGNQIWVVSYNYLSANSDDIAFLVKVDWLRNVYVNGMSDRGGGMFDYSTIKYSQPVGIETISNILPNRFYLYQNYPNPFNPTTSIEYQIENNGLVNLTVYDISGRVIEKLVHEYQKIGIYRVEFKSLNYSSGAYFYKLITQSHSETKKMIILK